MRLLRPDQISLREALTLVREKMDAEDCTGFCVRGRDANGKCNSGCPGPDEPGTQCYMLQGYDDRPTELIAAEVEQKIYGRAQ